VWQAIVSVGFVTAALFAVIAPLCHIQMYGDGSIFSYAVAARQSWAIHWHNISGRVFTYFYAHVPAEIVAGLFKNAEAGITVYGILFYAAPAITLGLTCWADRTAGRIILRFACLSTIILCPFVFGAPTEMWMAHALFWPTLALCLGYHRRGFIAAAALALIFTHEGAVVFLAAILIATAVHHGVNVELKRIAKIFASVLLVWIAAKILIRPDDYIAPVLGSAALRFIDPRNLIQPALLCMVTAFFAYAIVSTSIEKHVRFPNLFALVCCAFGLLLYWTFYDETLLAEGRYELRTALLALTPLLGLAATLTAEPAHKRLHAVPLAARLFNDAAKWLTPYRLAGMITLVSAVHIYETAKFLREWTDYRADIRSLAMQPVSNLELGSDHFVSSDRLSSDVRRMSWNSTTPYLSVLVAPELRPRRLVVEPSAGYFWVSCVQARQMIAGGSLIPQVSGEMIARYACLHRP
jgi:hypothetical protein